MAIRSIILMSILLHAVAGKAGAVSLTASPSTVHAGQPVTFVIGTSFAGTPGGCSINIDFGDQASQTGLSLGTPLSATAGLNFSQTVTHNYTRSGIFTATADVVGCTLAPPLGANPVSTQITVAGLTITRLELAFSDGKGQATVRRNEQGLRAKATLSTTGSGLLQGYWQVDDRPFPPVEHYVTFGQTVNIETPNVPPLPTFDSGDHILRFVVTSPGVSFSLPTLVYTVTAEEGRPIELRSPLPQTFLSYAPTSFDWHSQPGAGHYELKFLSQDGRVVFAAITKKTSYRLPEMALRQYFSPGGRYLWKVEAYDADGRPAGSSQPEAFNFLGLEQQ
jgi:hypothetical protein